MVIFYPMVLDGMGCCGTLLMRIIGGMAIPITLYMTRMVTWRSKMHTIMIHLKRRQRLMTALRMLKSEVNPFEQALGLIGE